MNSSAYRMNLVGKYEEAEVLAARAACCLDYRSIESQELVKYREDQLAAAAIEAAKFHVEPPAPGRAEPDWPMGVCRCCGQRRPIPPKMHVCLECFEEAA